MISLLIYFQIPEIITFMLLLIVFILAYGVAIQAIIDPYREFSLETIGKVLFSIVFMPYWQMYGELSLEDIAVQDSTGCINGSLTSSNTTVSSLDTTYLYLCLVLLWVQNYFGLSKSFWSSINCFGRVQFILVGFKSFWKFPNY